MSEVFMNYINNARQASNAKAGPAPNFADYELKPGESGDYAERFNQYMADTAAWQAKADGFYNAANPGAAFIEAQNPFVKVSSWANGAPGVSLRRSDYNDQLGKYKQQNPNVNENDPNFGATFANWLRNNNAPITMEDGRVLPGTAIGQTSPGLNLSGADAVKASQEYLAMKNAEERAGRLSGKIVGLSRGIALSGLAGAGLAGLGVGPLSGVGAGLQTGVSAGNAATSLGSNILNNFVTQSALKGAVTGAVGGYASTGEIGGALKGGALGGVTGGFGNAIGGGLGLTGAGQSAFTGALTGASGGLANNDAKNALLGGALGGAGGFVSGGGLGTAAGTPLDTASGVVGAQGPTAGTGITGALTRAVPSLGGVLSSGSNSGGSLGGLSNVKQYISPIASIYSGYTENKAIDDATKKMLASGDRAALGLQPYNQIGLNAQQALSGNLSSGFNPGDLSSDPGYQFRLAESQKALDRSLASTGMTQSGAAIKAAQDRAQGLAATEYGDAYNRWLAQNQQLAGLGNSGLQSAGALGNIYQNQGNVQGSSVLAKADSKNKTIASILAGIFG